MYRDNETTCLTPQDGNAWAIIANLTDTPSQVQSISSRLSQRWTRFGAPALEAHDSISPFVSGLELQAHFLAGHTSRALELIRTMWGFMLNDHRMTNSTFIEGYAVEGRLHYAPYANNPKISHAHGWSTSPTSTLMFYAAGIKLLTPGGRRWRIEPSLGDLKRVDAGFVTSLGAFKVNVTLKDGNGGIHMRLEAPVKTEGSVLLENPECEGVMEVRKVCGCNDNKSPVKIHKRWKGSERLETNRLTGGIWEVILSCD
jgi:Bacterial alpha-L-rhamnosidase C-terminal domain